MRLLIIVVLLFAGCNVETPLQAKTFQTFYEDGSTGQMKTIEDQEKVNEFLHLVNEVEFIPHEDQEGSVGWRYAVYLYDGKTVFNTDLSNIQNQVYHSKPNIIPLVDTFYMELNIEESPITE